MKKQFTTEPVLVTPDKKIKMEVDGLDYTTERVLLIECSNGKWRLAAYPYLSKSLNKTERNYEIHDKKMLVVIRRLEN